MSNEQLNLDMIMRNLPYRNATTREYEVRNILKYDGDSEQEPTRPSQPSQASCISVPPTEIIHQPSPLATAAAVERRPVPREGLVM